MNHQWQVTVDFDARPVDDDLAFAFLDALTEYGGAVSAGGTEVSATLTVTTQRPDAGRAAARGIEIATTALEQVSGQVERVRGVEALTADKADRRLAEPTVPDLVGTAEVADILDVSRQRVAQLHHDHSRFPPAMLMLRMGPLWTRGQIEAFADGWSRKPGRPAAVGQKAQRQRPPGWVHVSAPTKAAARKAAARAPTGRKRAATSNSSAQARRKVST